MEPSNLFTFTTLLHKCTIIIMITIFTTLANHSRALGRQYEACVPRTCGNRLNISYPFWISQEQESFCGYPNFEITCEDEEPVLRISNEDYIIKDFFYGNNSLLVASAAVYEETCPTPLHNLSLSRTPFNLKSTKADLFFWYNCTKKPPDYYTYPIDCASNATHYSFAGFHEEILVKANYSIDLCRNSVYVPVDVDTTDVGNLLQMNYTEILKTGFFLNWTAHNCSSCEASGIASAVGGIFMFTSIIICIYKWMKNSSKNDQDLEAFIRNHESLGEEIRLSGAMTSEEKDMAKKMIFAGLWCIQTIPLDRPSMNKGDDQPEYILWESRLYQEDNDIIDILSSKDEFIDEKNQMYVRNRPQYCGRKEFELRCDQDNEYHFIESASQKFRFLSINDSHPTMIVARDDLWNSSCPTPGTVLQDTIFNTSDFSLQVRSECEEEAGGFYTIEGSEFQLSNLSKTCKAGIKVPVLLTALNDLRPGNLGQVLDKGFDVEYKASNSSCSACEGSSGRCGSDNPLSDRFICYCPYGPRTYTTCSGLTAGLAGIAFTCIIICLFKLTKNKSMTSTTIFRKRGKNERDLEAFIRSYGSLAPTRYMYSDVKKMTNSFKDKLGQGGYGGKKRALVYEFMANGSLEKFIHNFCPKICDFGLAKLCPRKESMVSMLEARGTIGYIAPEVFSRNFGEVSHKSDVYSYGMMILEMVGGRKNLHLGVENSSKIYFPKWVYRHFELGNELKLHDGMTEEENEIAKRMIIVGLWCIQARPLDRPSMSKVIDMLQGSIEALQIPSNPFLSSPLRSPVEDSSPLSFSRSTLDNDL
ncbi:hypothetical protein EZV62_023958 [Acer yangbiense]|uniref:non-specific serine/threonine protein kinase n=1 Tax=Acer yangbiense TaxID=1000413 RepID=A0A5C7H374_9ROSI|nr:hypothetical protein EZV62_023958 [Acer yangbiense]